MRILGFSVAWLAMSAWGQPDPAALLEKARERAQAAAAGLSRYACSQTVHRQTYRPFPEEGEPLREGRKRRCHGDESGLQLARQDLVHLELTVDDGREMLSWPGESRTEQGGARALAADGLVTTGDFAAFLTDVFRRKEIPFVRWEDTAQGMAGVYRYTVPVAESQYAIDVGRGKKARMAFDGHVWVDAKSGDPRRLTVNVSQAPKGSGTCRLETGILYGRVERDWLRPVETRVAMWEEDGTRYENRTEFARCRTFGSESVLRTDTAVETGTETKRDAVPAGLQVRLRLLTPILAEKAAAGDAVDAVVAATVRDAEGKTVLAEGTPIQGRIVRATLHLRPSRFLVLALRFPGFAAATKSNAKMDLATSWEKEQGAGVYVISGRTFQTGLHFVTEWTTKPERP